jgi:phosphoesterase family protein
VEPAQNTLNDEVKAIMKSPCWSSTAIFVSWDDWGGEYDHVVPSSINSPGPGLGLRVPLIVISPYSKPGYVSHQLGEFSSFVKFVESDFSLPSLSGGERDSNPAISDLMDYFDFSQSPQPPPTDLPTDFPTLNLDMLHVPSQGLGLGTSGTLNPIIGGTNTQYTYSVVFTPSSTGVTATSAQVIIDGTSYPMQNSGKTSGGGPGIPGGTLYTYTTSLGIAPHTYSFSFTDSLGATQVLPHNGIPFRGPEVHSFTLNAATSSVINSPTLPGQPVKFTVTYTSLLNPAVKPTVAQIIIDGVAHEMTSTDKNPNYAKGAHYAYTAPSLSSGAHYAIFEFDDGAGDGAAAYPGRITPIVTPILLSNSVVSFAGNTATFQTTYSDANGKAPTTAYVYVDNVPYTMTCTPNCGSYLSPGTTFQYSMPLSSGKHSYFFVFSDGQSSWGDPVGPATYCINNYNAVNCTSGAAIDQASNQDNDPD